MSTIIIFFSVLSFAMASDTKIAHIDTIDGTLNEMITITIPDSLGTVQFTDSSSYYGGATIDFTTHGNDRFFSGKSADLKSTLNMMKIENVDDDSEEQYVGSILDETAGIVYQFSPDSHGDIVVVETKTSDFPRDLEPFDIDQLDSESVRGRAGVEESLWRVTEHVSNCRDDGSILDVMVVWTRKSECEISHLSQDCNVTQSTENNIRAYIDLAVQETNVAFTNSGIHTQLQLVHAYRHPTYSEDIHWTSLADPLIRLREGYVPLHDVKIKREEYKADLVNLMIHNKRVCGRGIIGPLFENMYSVSNIYCATGYYGFGHDIGHNLGLLDDRGKYNHCGDYNHNYGYRDPQARFRSVMASECRTNQCDGIAHSSCNRVQMFSNVQYMYNNEIIGDEFNDSARYINSVIEEVAGYYESDSECTAPTSSPTPVSTTCCPSGQFSFKLELLTDLYPLETSWNIKDDNGSIIDSGSPLKRQTLYEHEYCLDDGYYTFNIEDDDEDGICCYAGPGHFRGFLYGSSTPEFEGGEFGDSITKTIYGQDPCAPTQSPTQNPTISPTRNPTNSPTFSPTHNPTQSPTQNPSNSPTLNPTINPTLNPTHSPTHYPTSDPTQNPSNSPSFNPTINPTLHPTSTPTLNPTSHPTLSPTLSPTISPTLTQNPTVSVNPTLVPTSSFMPTIHRDLGDEWAITNTTFNYDQAEMFISHDINSGPQRAELLIYKSDCVTELGGDDIISVISGPDVIFSEKIKYTLSLDEANLEFSDIVTFEDSSNGTGTISFCTQLNTMTAERLIVASKELKFTLGFDMINLEFDVGTIVVDEDDPQGVPIDLIYEATACECDFLFRCVSNVYVLGSTPPILRICITPINDALTVSNMYIKFSRNGIDYEPVKFGADGPLINDITMIHELGSTKMVETLIVNDLFDGSDISSMTVSGSCFLQLSGKKAMDAEFYAFDLNVYVQGVEDDAKEEEKGCLQILLKLFI